MKNWFFGLLFSFALITAGDAKLGDILYVQSDGARVLRAPRKTASLVLRLNHGHKLVEFGRSGAWVNVGIDRTGGKTGWIRKVFVGAKLPVGGGVAPPDAKFDRFRAAVKTLNAKVRKAAGVDFFTKVENLGDGIVQVTATDVWLAAPIATRQRNLNTLFNLWDAADGTDLAIMVKIVDGRGVEKMKKARR